MTQKHVLLTGATGFVGAALLKFLLVQNYRVSVLSRRPIDMVSTDLDVLLIDDLEALCEPIFLITRYGAFCERKPRSWQKYWGVMD